MNPTRTMLLVLVVVVGVILLASDTEADKHKLVKKVVLKKLYKHIKKGPKVIPLVIPLPIIKHQPKRKEVWKVEEVHSHGHGWW